MTDDIARAGKHVVCEKPLCMTLDEADEMIDVCRREGVLLLYAEELLFTPKYVKAKEMADHGAFGKLYLVKQSEKHFGPHSPWFWDVDRSGGGVFMDMGCHGIAFCYWFYDRSPIKSVTCHMGTYVHGDKTRGEDDSICILEFANGGVGLVENSWAKRGGMDDRTEIYGEGGVSYPNLHMGNAMPTYSEYGYGYAVEKAPSTKGWSYPVFDELWNYGSPHEMRHFARCVRGKEKPQSTGEDGRVVMEALYAGYASAGQGRKIELPFRPSEREKADRPLENSLTVGRALFAVFLELSKPPVQILNLGVALGQNPVNPFRPLIHPINPARACLQQSGVPLEAGLLAVEPDLQVGDFRFQLRESGVHFGVQAIGHILDQLYDPLNIAHSPPSTIFSHRLRSQRFVSPHPAENTP